MLSAKMTMITAALILFCASAALSVPTPVHIDPFASWRVVGGSTAATGQFPYIISLRTSTNSHTCGGSLIRNDWVITAAHCVVGRQPSSLSVVAGVNQLNSNGGVRSQISQIISHPNYNANTITNDIALLRLSSSIQETDLIRLIELETVNNDTPRPVTLSGWGRTSYPGTIPNNLQWIELRSLTVADCKNRWSTETIIDSEICTLTQSGQGACHGDSGGPLVDVSSGTPKLTGIVSWGAPCALGAPDVFTRVSSFIPWINQNIGN